MTSILIDEARMKALIENCIKEVLSNNDKYNAITIPISGVDGTKMQVQIHVTKEKESFITPSPDNICLQIKD
ncbi:MAG: hypothetical protein HAW67_04410 [Endozoicomonadaceae bacterium]|nr:hypothetical protein [Endozoicomonadaceae bacterium]